MGRVPARYNEEVPHTRYGSRRAEENAGDT
jgi:hypothetical protein